MTTPKPAHQRHDDSQPELRDATPGDSRLSRRDLNDFADFVQRVGGIDAARELFEALDELPEAA